MSSLRSPVTRDGFSFGKNCESGEHFLQNPAKSMPPVLDCMSESTLLLLDHFSARCTAMGIEVRPDELRELGMFTAFVSSRVKAGDGRGVPCMSLWAEWVRYSLKHMNSFPGLIYENEFKNLIVNRFDCAIADVENCGPVYSGIEFIPERNISIHLTDSSFAQA